MQPRTILSFSLMFTAAAALSGPARTARAGSFSGAPGSRGVDLTLLRRSLQEYPTAGSDEALILANRKRVFGRAQSLAQIRRVALELRPLVDQALGLPDASEVVRQLAARRGITSAAYQSYFAGKQEADLLLESGGNPEARSVSDAIGVAQFMPATARRCGLRVDRSESNRLSREIAAADRSLEFLASQPEDWSKRGPDGSLWTRRRWILHRLGGRQALATRRKQVDHRFDPARAIPAQTRYLLSLTRRYGDVDWALQAYHGGEGGVGTTLALLKRSPSKTFRLASRSGAGIPYGAAYRALNPIAAPEAFHYVYGRSDDHRYYWWKVLMAERCLSLFRADPAECERQWASLAPGRPIEAAWYPEAPDLRFSDEQAVRQGLESGALAPLTPKLAKMGVRTTGLSDLKASWAPLSKCLRPESLGLLARVAADYRYSGGRSALTITAMARSQEYQSLWEAAYQPLKPGEAPPLTPSYLTSGWIFHLAPPTDRRDRRILEYVLGRLYDSLQISWRLVDVGPARRYVIVPNPEFKPVHQSWFRSLAVEPTSKASQPTG